MIQVRHAEPRDASEWASLRSVLWPEDAREAHAEEVARFFATRPAGPGTIPEAVFVALDPARPSALLGFAEVSRRGYAPGCASSPVGFLEGWYVVASHRRQGVGRALVAAAEQWAASLGCREFGSDALAENEVSARAHQALGFAEVEVIRCFRKDLGPPAAA